MGEVVNLRLARKAKARSEKEAQAAENRLRHGQTKQERSARKAHDLREAKHLDGHRLSPDADGK